MKRMILTTITFLLALAIMALLSPFPASANWGTNWDRAAEPDYDIFAYGNPITEEAWIAGRLPMGSAYEAKSLVNYTDADDISRNLDMMVLASDVNYDLEPLGIGPMAMYAGVMGNDDAVALLTSYGADVWLFVIVLPDISDLDAEAVVMWTVETMTNGIASAPGAGFIAVNTGDVPAWSTSKL